MLGRGPSLWGDTAAVQVPSGFEEAVCSLAKLERAIVSCPAQKAQRPEPGVLLPPPPDGTDRVEFELQLLSMIQVPLCFECSLEQMALKHIEYDLPGLNGRNPVTPGACYSAAQNTTMSHLLRLACGKV